MTDKLNRIQKAQILIAQIVEELEDISSDQGITICSDYDLEMLEIAFNNISTFNSKQGH